MSAPKSANAKGPSRGSFRRWRFSDCEFDEWSRQLIVRGKPATLEAKPLQVLEQLLLAPGKEISKEALKDAVWGAETVDESLTTAIFKLRNAIGGPRESAIQTVHGVGYRFIAPVECTESEESSAGRLEFHVNDAVPGYADEYWRLEEPLDGSRRPLVWLAKHRETQEVHVFKFADDERSRDSLERELAVVRHLRRRFGQAAPVVAAHGCRLDKSPYFLESDYGGPDLRQWAEKQVQLENVSLAERIQLAAAIADAVEAFHEAGLLHNNLRPEHILISPANVGSKEGWRVRLSNFALATLKEERQRGNADWGDLKAYPDADLALLAARGPEIKARLSVKAKGEATYFADELRSSDAGPGVLTDVYSLGVILYQLVCGDLNERPSPGWDLRVPDLLLQEDISAAANGDPVRRMVSARELAGRIRKLEERHEERRQLRDLTDRAARAERSLAESRARRPWILAAVGILFVGLAASLWFYYSALKERNTAVQETAAAEAMNKFLADDLLQLNNPLDRKTELNISLQAAIQHAARDIDQQFAHQPMIAARLDLTIAGAFDNRFQYQPAEQEYESAARDFQRNEGIYSRNAALAVLRECLMWARSALPGSVDHARDRLSKEKQLLTRRSSQDREIDAWVLADEAVIALQTNQMKEAEADSEQAIALASGDPPVNTQSRLKMLQVGTFVDLRTGNAAKAEQYLRSEIPAIRSAEGPQSPTLLVPGLQLEMALLLQKKFGQAVEQANAIYPQFVKKLGQDHDLTLQVIGTRAAAEGSMGRLDDSIRDDLETYALAHNKNPHSFFALGTLTDVATTEAKKKDWTNCERYARQSWDAISRETHLVFGLKDGTAEALANCLVEDGTQRNTEKLSEAENLLRTVDVSAVAGRSSDPGSLVDLPLLKGEIALARGQYDVARNHAAQAEQQLKKLLIPDAERVAAVQSLRQDLARKH